MFTHRSEWFAKVKKVYHQDPAEQAGLDGEKKVKDAVISILGKSHSRFCYDGLRVPRHDTWGKYEIDLVVVGKDRLFLFEVKHWSGVITRDAKTFVQRPYGSGVCRSHKDPTELLRQKSDALLQYLHARKIELRPDQVYCGVIFSNQNCDIHMSNPTAMLYDVWKHWFARQWQSQKSSFGERVLKYLGKNQKRNFQNSSLTEYLNQLPTWDVVKLHGGRIICGDVSSPIILEGGDKVGRASTQRLAFTTSRSVLAWLHPGVKFHWWDYSGAKKRARVRSGTSIRIIAPGHPTEIEIPLETITQIDFGWQNEGYFRTQGQSP